MSRLGWYGKIVKMFAYLVVSTKVLFGSFIYALLSGAFVLACDYMAREWCHVPQPNVAAVLTFWLTITLAIVALRSYSKRD